MKVSIKSLQKYTPIKLNKEELIDRVFRQIGAVEEIIELGDKYKGVKIAKIEEKQDHPTADKLAVYQLNIGEKENVQVVAGDKTLEKGTLVAYFAPGVKVPYNAHPEKYDGIITKVKLKDVESNGMMGSEKELDLGADHTQVMRLDIDAQPGDDFAQVLGLDDTVMDIENKALANRGDLFGLINVAREISGLQGMKFTTPDWLVTALQIKGEEKAEVRVTNNAQAICPRYMAVVMDNVKIQPSPVWLKIEIIKAGMRPVNNIVDITNYLMYLTSQPLHAFDYNKIIAKQKNKNFVDINVRMAEENERITVIDGKEVTLDNTMMVIADDTSAIAVAGIMGGKDTEIDDDTKKIVIECANFDRYNLRKTSMKLGIFSEAVTRYTKAIDPNLCDKVLAKTVEMIEQLGEGKVVSKTIDVYTTPYEAKTISFTLSQVNKHLGLNLISSDIKDILENINYDVQIEGDNITCTPLTIRQDIAIKEDVFEDIGRQYGYNNIVVSVPTRDITPAKKNDMLDLKTKVRSILSCLGGNEILTYNFTSETLMKKLQLDINDAYHLKNAISPELTYMRTHLIPSVLEKAQFNLTHGYDDFMLFEINKCHNKTEQDANENLPYEKMRLAICNVDKNVDGSSYYAMKSVISELLSELGVNNVSYKLLANVAVEEMPYWLQKSHQIYRKNRSAVILVNDSVIGIIGEAANFVKTSLKLPECTSIAEFDMDEILMVTSNIKKYQEPSKFPAVVEDHSFELMDNILCDQLLDTIKETFNYNDIMCEVSVVDIFKEDGKDTKKITVEVKLHPLYATLTNEKVQEIRAKIINEVSTKLNGKVA